jgi:hypothetical protein
LRTATLVTSLAPRLQRDHGCVIADRAQGRHGGLHRLPDRTGMHLADSNVGSHRGRLLHHRLLVHLAFALKGGHLLLPVLSCQLHGPHLHLLRHLAGEAPRHILRIIVRLAILRRGMARVGLGAFSLARVLVGAHHRWQRLLI